MTAIRPPRSSHRTAERSAPSSFSSSWLTSIRSAWNVRRAGWGPGPPRGRRDGVLDDLDELAGGGKGAAGARGYDEGCDARRPPFLAVLAEDAGELGFVSTN